MAQDLIVVPQSSICFKEAAEGCGDMEFEVPTWSQIYNMLLSLAVKIEKSMFAPDIIVGVSRGGWIPARVLADLLGNPNLVSIGANFYSGVAETKGEPAITHPLSVSVFDRKVLVVDEIVDTGKTLGLVREHVVERGAEEVRIAAIYVKPGSIVKPDYCEKETHRWIVFPWEIKETVRKIIEEARERGTSEKEGIAQLVRSGAPSELVKSFAEEIFEEKKC